MSTEAEIKKETVEIQKELFDGKKSSMQKYQELIIGSTSMAALIRYELIVTLFSALPGAFGLLMRSKLYPKLLGSCGRNVAFGTNVVLRHPGKIHIGDNVVIDDNVVLDAKGEDNKGLFIGSGVFIGRNTILSCKNGDIHIDDEANIGFNCEIFSANSVRVGKKVLMAAYCYLVGGTHTFNRTDIPMLYQEREARGIEVGDHAWLGAHAVVFDGTTIGKECVIGAGSIVNRDIPDWQIAVGSPARVVKDRRELAEEEELADV